MSCYVIVSDGLNPPVHMEDVPGLDVNFGRVSNGGAIRRFLSGRAIKQTRFQKRTITISGEDRLPPGLRDLDYSRELTVTVVTGLGAEVFTCISEPGAEEHWGLKTAQVTWSLPTEET